MHRHAEDAEEAHAFGSIVVEQVDEIHQGHRKLALNRRLVAHEHAVPQTTPDLFVQVINQQQCNAIYSRDVIQGGRVTQGGQGRSSHATSEEEQVKAK